MQNTLVPNVSALSSAGSPVSDTIGPLPLPVRLLLWFLHRSESLCDRLKLLLFRKHGYRNRAVIQQTFTPFSTILWALAIIIGVVFGLSLIPSSIWGNDFTSSVFSTMTVFWLGIMFAVPITIACLGYIAMSLVSFVLVFLLASIEPYLARLGYIPPMLRLMVGVLIAGIYMILMYFAYETELDDLFENLSYVVLVFASTHLLASITWFFVNNIVFSQQSQEAARMISLLLSLRHISESSTSTIRPLRIQKLFLSYFLRIMNGYSSILLSEYLNPNDFLPDRLTLDENISISLFAEDLFLKLDLQRKEYLTMKEFIRYLMISESIKLWNELNRPSLEEILSAPIREDAEPSIGERAPFPPYSFEKRLRLNEFTRGVRRIVKNSAIVRERVNFRNSIVRIAAVGYFSIFWAIAIGLAVIIIGIEATNSFIPILSLGLGLSFIFGSTAAVLFQGISFMFISRPFEPGDWIDTGDQFMLVMKISPFYSYFRNLHGERITMANTALATTTISNWSQSTSVIMRPKFSVNMTTVTREKIVALGAKVQDLARTYPYVYRSDFDFKLRKVVPHENIVDFLINVPLTRAIKYHYPYDSWYEVRSHFAMFLLTACQELQISFSNPVQLSLSPGDQGVRAFAGIFSRRYPSETNGNTEPQSQSHARAEEEASASAASSDEEWVIRSGRLSPSSMPSSSLPSPSFSSPHDLEESHLRHRRPIVPFVIPFGTDVETAENVELEFARRSRITRDQPAARVNASDLEYVPPGEIGIELNDRYVEGE